VAQHHLEIKRKLGRDPEESPGVRVGCSLVDDGEGVREEDHQGEKVTNEEFSQAWLASKSMSHNHYITFVVINQVGAEGGVDFLSLKNFFQFIRWLDGPPAYPPSLLGSGMLLKVDLVLVSIFLPEAKRSCTIAR